MSKGKEKEINNTQAKILEKIKTRAIMAASNSNVAFEDVPIYVNGNRVEFSKIDTLRQRGLILPGAIGLTQSGALALYKYFRNRKCKEMKEEQKQKAASLPFSEEELRIFREMAKLDNRV